MNNQVKSPMDRVCVECGTDIAQDGYAIGKYRCGYHAVMDGSACSLCLCDAGNGCGGYSNCCGYPLVDCLPEEEQADIKAAYEERTKVLLARLDK